MKFAVTGICAITVTTVVEATSAEAARAIAKERHTSGAWEDTGNSDEVWTHDELDGHVAIMTIKPIT